MAIQTLKITNEWMKISDGELVVLQNTGLNEIEVATTKSGDKPDGGFIIRANEYFSYPGGENVWVRSKIGNSYIAIDKIGGE